MKQMKKMSPRERLLAALSFQETDRIPYSIWTHYPGADLFADRLVRVQVRDAITYAFDFIKVPNHGLFTVLDYGTEYAVNAQRNPVTDKYGSLVVAKYGVERPEDWANLKILDPERGCLGEQVQIVRMMKRALADAGAGDVPVIATIYSPLTTAYKLAGDRLLRDIEEHPARVHKALAVLAEMTARYAESCVRAGAEGFFFASQLSNYRAMDEKTYEAFGEPYDLQVFESFIGETFFNIVHIHGEHAMFDKLAGYPANCISWHDRWIGPSLREARKRTKKCLLGGIDEENALGVVGDAAFARHVDEAMEQGGSRGFIMGPGCTAYPHMPESHLRIVMDKLGSSAVSAP